MSGSGSGEWWEAENEDTLRMMMRETYIVQLWKLACLVWCLLVEVFVPVMVKVVWLLAWK